MKKIFSILFFISLLTLVSCDNNIHKEYYESGALKAEGKYKNGKLDGKSIVYYEDGSIYVEGSYKEGIENGIFKRYFSNGNLELDGTYREGKLNGVCKYYYENGNIESIIQYKDGEVISTIDYDEDGDIIPEIKVEISKPVIQVGETYNAKIFPLPLPSEGKIEAFIGNIDGDGNLISGGYQLPFENGYAHYTKKMETAGIGKVSGIIQITKSNGKVNNYPFSFEYLVE